MYIKPQADTRYERLQNNTGVVIFVTKAVDEPNLCIDTNLNLEDAWNQYINNVKAQTGELVITSKENMVDFDMEIISRSGEMFISCEDSKNYSINDNGELIYTFR